MNQFLEPADNVIRRFGGAGKLAELLGLSRSQVHRWRLERTRGGCDGVIPRAHHVKLIELATRHDVPLSNAELAPWLNAQDAAE